MFWMWFHKKTERSQASPSVFALVQVFFQISTYLLSGIFMQKRRTLRGYIFYIFQHLATNLFNFIYSGMLFSAVQNSTDDLSSSPFSLFGQWSVCLSERRTCNLLWNGREWKFSITWNHWSLSQNKQVRRHSRAYEAWEQGSSCPPNILWNWGIWAKSFADLGKIE